MERFEFQYESTPTAPPTGSELRFDAADPEAITRLWVRYVTVPGEDAYPLLLAIGEGFSLYVQDYDDHTRYVRVLATGPAEDKGTYAEIPVAWVASGSALAEQKVSLYAVSPFEAAPPPVPGVDEGTEFLPDDVPPEQAAELVALARLILNAALYPNELPASPLPAPLEVALALVTRRLYDLATEGGTRPVVSESLGAYSYRLADPASPESVFILSGPVLKLIGPWMPAGKGGVYELHTGRPWPLGWPADWWQRDYDNWLALADLEAVS